MHCTAEPVDDAHSRLDREPDKAPGRLTLVIRKPRSLARNNNNTIVLAPLPHAPFYVQAYCVVVVSVR
mgnify:CR=1 FL=1